ncbi:MAG: PaaI family thioesterase [Candidatus Eremiobacteraeota bacterium]|nr:PaaI family thioesterase [Candidatus Eremiobacteraeota bacterium]
MSVPFDDGNCFACGPENPIGLHLHFENDGAGVRARITLSENFQGWKSIAHGGIAIALLDEAMAHAAGHAGHRGVTGSMSVRFRKPVPIGVPLDVRGQVAWHRRNVLGLVATVSDESGKTLVHADGNFVSMATIDAALDRRNPAMKK